MSSKRLAGLAAVLAIAPFCLAHAEPGNRWGGTVYLVHPQPAPAAPPTPAPSVAPAEAIAPQKLKHLSWRARRAVREAAANIPIETVPAPSPADTKNRPPAATDGPREGPAPTIQALVTKHARENGVPENLASAVVRIESRFNPNARGGSAIGLMQIKVQTARSVGFAGDARGLMSPDTNLHFGMKVLADAYKASKGDVCLALAKYQSGHLTTRLSAANRAYCARARTFMAKA